MFVQRRLSGEIFPTFWTLNYTVIFMMMCVQSLTLENVLSHNLHLIFRLLDGSGTSVLGFIDPSVPTCNVDRYEQSVLAEHPMHCLLVLFCWWWW